MVKEYLNLREIANAEFRAGRLGAALAIYTQALQKATKDSERALILANRAAAHLQLHDYNGALKDVDRAIELDPKNVKAHFRRAKALYALGRCTAAADALTAAQELEPCNDQIKNLEDSIHSSMTLGNYLLPKSILPSMLSSAPHETIPPIDDVVHENLLLLFHGLGDTPRQYAKLAKSLQLPQTAAIALGAPHEVPFSDGGRSWFTVFDDELKLIPGTPGEHRRIQSLETTVKCIMRLLESLHARGWKRSRVHLFGFSQGGTVALEVARCAARGGLVLGSCIAIASGCLQEQLDEFEKVDISSERCIATPILLLHGEADTVVARSRVKATAAMLEAEGFESVKFQSIEGKRHEMISGADEIRILMQFWAQHLSCRPESCEDGDVVEVSASGILGTNV